MTGVCECGAPTLPRKSNNGPRPRWCADCKRQHSLQRDREWRANSWVRPTGEKLEQRREYHRQYRAAHREEMKEYLQQYHQRPERQEIAKQQKAEWRTENLEKALEAGRKSYRKYREKRLEKHREYNAANKEELYEKHKARIAADPVGHRERCRANKYGFTVAEMNQFISKAGGVCALCRRPRRLVIDHDHDTGRNRGMLCRPCNAALGLLGDNVKGVLRVDRYLQASRTVIRIWDEQPTRPPRNVSITERARAKKHGISVGQLRKLMTRCRRACEICRKKTDLRIDHDLMNYQIRGVLCAGCNRAMTNLGCDRGSIDRILAYLDEPTENTKGIAV